MRGCCSKTTPRVRMAYETASIASLLQYGMDLDSLPALLADSMSRTPPQSKNAIPPPPKRKANLVAVKFDRPGHVTYRDCDSTYGERRRWHSKKRSIFKWFRFFEDWRETGCTVRMVQGADSGAVVGCFADRVAG